jgi:endonuclease/exonuclease/phosphatase family metal-dependent hydrolase
MNNGKFSLHLLTSQESSYLMVGNMKTPAIFLLIVLFLLSGCSPRQQDRPIVAVSDTLTICSFNIQFLGQFKKKENEALAELLKDFDIVVVQELVAPPVSGEYPNGNSFAADDESAAFLHAMQAHGFDFVLSEKDTGPGETIHTTSTATEWWITFFKPARVTHAHDLPSGFLADDRSKNDNFDRVPYAFAFRSANKKLDFVLLSVHLAPGASKKERRKIELTAISDWINANNHTEKDFIILGDMNIENCEELQEVTPPRYLSLNDECRKTNTVMTAGSGKPYDHVMYDTVFTKKEIDLQFDLFVLDLIEAMKDLWKLDDPYPGEPYDHNLFRQYYSDHHPVVFKMVTQAQDDD